MKLFQRIFATFCAVIICAIFVASFSFWLVQQTQAENHFNQQRVIDEIMLSRGRKKSSSSAVTIRPI